MKLATGATVRNAKTIRLADQENDDWEPFNRGVLRNRFTNELKARSEIKDLVVRGRVFQPGELTGTVEDEDELNPGHFTVQWKDPNGGLLSTSSLAMSESNWYAIGDLLV